MFCIGILRLRLTDGVKQNNLTIIKRKNKKEGHEKKTFILLLQ